MERTQQNLPRSQSEALGISAAAIVNFLLDIQKQQLELHSFMLLRHGQVAAEGWWSPYSADLPHMMFSLSKSFTSTAIGLAAEERILSLDDSVLSFFTEDAPEVIDPHLAAMRVRHLLMMGTGNEEDTTGRMHESDDGNWVKAFLRAPVEHEPGTHFVYNSGATYMLSAILQKVTGQTLLDYLQPRLFEPLGIEGAAWESCPRGMNTGGWGLSIKTEDIAKFGQLYLQKGVWNGKHILPEAWIEEATSKQISNGDGGDNDWAQGYGYQFWRCRHDVYRGDGAFGQFCIVMPEQDAVLAITSGTNDMQAVMNAVWDHLLPAMGSEAVATDSDMQQKLNRQLQELSLPAPRELPESLVEDAVSGETYQLEDNDLQLTSITLAFNGNRAEVRLCSPAGEHQIQCGRGEWAEGTSSLDLKHETRTFSSFTWVNQDTLKLSLRFVETPFYMTSIIQFDGNEIILNRKINVSFGPLELADIRGRKVEIV
ncbi:serine hydrolase domain-containing protein [Paenibacillus nasutitermitis]|uniref:Beta-lactamase-related domain-containing protein n=1 Tax=Paenibacillus nasutitermitis TaxID=1652958 RepID=A0A917DQS1_9BACL|nr:serine hydrolase [Paenibacillus nasutitermitis]GGD57724.1 hypothetical protein GCM10010911_14390 [Paenibacillus nasutitermitis]